MIYEFLADGFEELEAIAPLDLLRRASKLSGLPGLELQTVGVGPHPGVKTVTGRSGVAVSCDIALEEVDQQSIGGVILPGGPGYTRLAESGELLECVAIAAKEQKLLAAICAAPSILGQNGWLKGRRACCFPGYEKDLFDAQVVDDPVVRHGNVITSRGAGTSVLFALAIVSFLASPAVADQVAAQIQCP